MSGDGSGGGPRKDAPAPAATPADTPAVNRETALVRAGVAQDVAHGAVAPALYLSTTYAWRDPAQKPVYDYGRSNNPSRAQLERALTELEGGADGVVTGSGMAALDVAFSLLRPGDVLIAPHDCYGGTHRLLSARHARGHFTVAFVDQTDLAAVDKALTAHPPRMMLVETPSNPLMRITDIAAMVSRAQAAGAWIVADNTFLSPARQRPLDLGCDIVVHSTTKYLNGHTDVVGGAAIAKDPAIAQEMAWWANCAGLTGGPFDAYQTLRGMRTLFTRLARQEETAATLAAFLRAHAGVSVVHYPGFIDHPGHAIAQRQQSGFGAMLSFELGSHDAPDAAGRAAERFLAALRIIAAAASLGGFETLACRPATMTHAGMEPQARRDAGVHDGLIRLSVGLEDAADLQADLSQALEAAAIDD